MHNVPRWKLSLHLIGLSSIYHHFQVEEKIILAQFNALLYHISEKHVTPILTSTYLETKSLHNLTLWVLSLHLRGLLSIYQTF
jgi:hypothetical protein